MPRPLYLVVSVAALVVLVASAALVFTYKPSDGSAAVVATATPSGSAVPGSTDSAPGSTAGPSQAPTDSGPIDSPLFTPLPTPLSSTAKQTGPHSLDPEELTGYIWPVKHALITSRFAPRDFGAFLIVDGQRVHDGLDIATHCGDKVRAAHSGTVLYGGRNFDPYIGYLGDAGAIYERLERLHRVNDQPIVVVVDNGDGYRSIYMHLQEAIAEAGQQVAAGDVIGLEGATGYASGCHLHYGMVRMDGPWQQLVPELAPLRVSADSARAHRSVEGSAVGRSRRAAAVAGQGQRDAVTAPADTRPNRGRQSNDSTNSKAGDVVRHMPENSSVTRSMANLHAAAPLIRVLILIGLVIVLIMFGLPSVLAIAAAATL